MITIKLHLGAISTVFELLIMGSIIGLSVDAYWMVYEISYAGSSVSRVGILGGLLLSDILTIIGGWKHHTSTYNQLRKECIATKKSIQRSKNKHKRTL